MNTLAQNKCRLCSADVIIQFQLKVLRKNDVQYFRCSVCDLLQTEDPTWLHEAYSEAISSLDTGAMQRTTLNTDLTAIVLRTLNVACDEPCLDYGGGPGTLTRIMRDQGANFFHHDLYCDNVYAKGFSGSLSAKYELVSAFEVFEHFGDVIGQATRVFDMATKAVFIGTALSDNRGSDWWYLVPDSGQHIAFFSRKTMDWLAVKYDCRVFSGSAYTLFVRNQIRLSPVAKALLWLTVRRPSQLRVIGAFYRAIGARKSRVQGDFELCRRAWLAGSIEK